MTIALAIQEDDGVVLAADTLISSDYIKGNEHKIVRVWDPLKIPGAAAIAGAGDAGYIDAYTRGCAQVFTDNPTDGPRDLLPKFEKHLEDFYARKVIPFAQFPENERPFLEMLIGVYRQEPMLFVTDHNTIRKPVNPRYATVGKGGGFADILLRRFWKRSNVRAAEILAAYIVFRVKETIESCGNYTTVVTLAKTEEYFKDGSKTLIESAHFIRSDRMDSIERDFRVWWTHAEQELLWEKIAEMTGPSDTLVTPSTP